MPATALCPFGCAVASASPWLHWAEGSAVCAKKRWLRPQPLTAGLPVEFGAEVQCSGEQQLFRWGLPLCPPSPPAPFTLPVRQLLLSLLRSVSLCPCAVSSAVLHISCQLFSPLTSSSLLSSPLFCPFPPFIVSVCTLLRSSPSPSCLCPLPDCCIPALPSDRGVWGWCVSV